MYFDLEDFRPDAPTIASPLSRREGVLLSIIAHLVFAILLLIAPQLPWVKSALARMEQQAEQQRIAVLQKAQDEQRRFVFVQPLKDLEALKPPRRDDDSDKNRVATAPERAQRPTNPLPYSRGNSPEMVEAQPEARAQGEGSSPDPSQLRNPPVEASDPQGRNGSFLPDRAGPVLTLPQNTGNRATALPGGPLGDQLRNLQRYVQQDSFQNEQGGADAFGPSIQFDTKGVEFGPWIRRFIAQIKRNWFIPYAAWTMKGHVVMTFNVHKSGAITELNVAASSSIDSFNNAAYNALTASNPTQPLPPEYPSESCFFTVTFSYNETPFYTQ